MVGGSRVLGQACRLDGLTAIGARYYDPAIGRFVSVDPVMDLADPQQWHGYAYAHSSPVTFSDPTGLREVAGDGRHDTREQIKSAVNHTKKGGGWIPPVVDPPVKVKPVAPKTAPSCGCHFEQNDGPGTFKGKASDIPFEGLPAGTKVDQSLYAELMSYPIPPAWAFDLEPLVAACTEASLSQGDACYDNGPKLAVQASTSFCAGACVDAAVGSDPDLGPYATVGTGIGLDVGFSIAIEVADGVSAGPDSGNSFSSSAGLIGLTGSTSNGPDGSIDGWSFGYSPGAEAGHHVTTSYTWILDR